MVAMTAALFFASAYFDYSNLRQVIEPGLGSDLTTALPRIGCDICPCTVFDYTY